MPRKPCLLVLASTYPRWTGDHEPAFVHELAKRLTNDFEVLVLCPHAKGAPTRESLGNVSIQRYRYAPRKWETLVQEGGIVTNLRRKPIKWLLVPLFLLAQAWITWRVVRNRRPDVIHAHWLIPQGLIIALLSLVCRHTPPFLVTSHGADLHSLQLGPMLMLKRFVARRAAIMTVVSSAMLKVMKAQGIPTECVRVEPMGVDLEHRFTPDESVPRSTNEILFVGRLVEKKGLRYLLDAMPAILEKHPSANLSVAGFGPEESALRQQVKALGIQHNVRFLGPVSQNELPKLYRRTAVFVAPFIEAGGGDQEGLGLVMVEAIGCGCLVVASDLPAVRDVIKQPEFRVSPGRPTEIAAAVSRIIDMPGDKKLKLSTLSRERVISKFDWHHRAKAYARLLNEIAHPPGIPNSK